MTDAAFRHVFEEFLARLSKVPLTPDQREVVRRVVSKRLAATVAAAPSAAMDEQEMQQKTDEFYPTPAPEQEQQPSPLQQSSPQVECPPAYTDGADAASVRSLTSNGSLVDPRSLSKIELAIADRLHQHGSLSESFIAFDQIGDGTLTPIELQAAVNSLGIFLYEEEVQALIEKYDISKDGCLDYDEFAKAIGRVDLSRLSTHSYDEALIGRPAPVPPTMFDLKPSEEIKLRHLVEEIRAKVCSHWRSSRRAFLELQALGGHSPQLTVPKFALALRKVGLKIDPADLKKTVRPYMEESKDKSYLTITEFERFIQGAPTRTKISVAEKPPPLVDPQAPVSQAVQVLLEVIQHDGESAMDTFRRCDVNNDGLISPAELRYSLLAMGHNIDLRACIALVKQHDKNGDGHLDYSELLEMLENQRSSRKSRASLSTRTYDAKRYDNSSSLSTESKVQESAVTATPFRSPTGSVPASPVNAGVRMVTPSRKLLKQVCDAVYGSGFGAARLYKKMRQHGELSVDAKDLAYGLSKIQIKLSPEEAAGLVHQFDADRDGKLSMGEFLNMLSVADEVDNA